VPQATHIGSGKVRELFEVGTDQLVLVASDRISAYDVVLPQLIPNKGKVLTGLSCHWFRSTTHICPNHLLSVSTTQIPLDLEDLPGRAMLCRRAEAMPVEFVVRGYLSGSGWRDYLATGSTSGHELPVDLRESDKLPQPIVTPATKAVTGHDENISEERAAEVVGADRYEAARTYALALYNFAAKEAASRGIIIADTKFEFGVADGEVILIDEALTPDSSRFWPADGYEPGRPQASFDKQYVRDWLDASGWDHVPPAPDLPEDVVTATRRRYIEGYERVTGRGFAQWLEEAAG
jgi:phosphoribosylaminoimidazole-succinocarboxamide synthase